MTGFANGWTMPNGLDLIPTRLGFCLFFSGTALSGSPSNGQHTVTQDGPALDVCPGDRRLDYTMPTTMPRPACDSRGGVLLRLHLFIAMSAWHKG